MRPYPLDVFIGCQDHGKARFGRDFAIAGDGDRAVAVHSSHEG
ncbi:MAG: hypothetical protein ACJ8R9_27120 [Steroidobacteraceae bacterium]